MQIYLGRGVDQISFGMTESDLIDLLGVPDKICVNDSGNRDLLYYQLKLILKIEPSNGSRLGWISVRNRAARLGQMNPWAVGRIEVLAYLASQLGEVAALDDYEWMESYSFNRAWVELQFELGELTSFNFGVPYGDDDEPIWPARWQ
jgi:hypothetical protein